MRADVKTSTPATPYASKSAASVRSKHFPSLEGSRDEASLRSIYGIQKQILLCSNHHDFSAERAFDVAIVRLRTAAANPGQFRIPNNSLKLKKRMGFWLSKRSATSLPSKHRSAFGTKSRHTLRRARHALVQTWGRKARRMEPTDLALRYEEIKGDKRVASEFPVRGAAVT